MTGVVVVTGAGRGLGRALVRVFAARGCAVAALGRTLPDLQETVAGTDARAVICDLADDASVARAFAEVRDRLGPVDVLVNNAALYPRRDFLDESPASFLTTVQAGLGGAVRATRHALDDMVAAGTGRIVTVGSFADVHPIPLSSAYAVTKGAQRILTRALVADLGDRFPDIVLSDWMPGMLHTRMGLPEGLSTDVAAEWGVALALWRDRSLNGTVWDRDREVPPPRSLRQRLADRLTRRRVSPRTLAMRPPS